MAKVLHLYSLRRDMQPFLLCVIDGFGLNPKKEGNAVQLARTPQLTKLFSENPFTTLITHGERVGLPDGQMGNSEVGHLNIGAGRVVEQWLLRISRALQGDFLKTSSTYRHWLTQHNSVKQIHLVGLYSDGGVHSHSEHFKLLLTKLSQDTKAQLLIHLITDGRDTSPSRAKAQVPELLNFIKTIPRCEIASVCGRFFAMDRDKRWERTGKAFELISQSKGERIQDVNKYILDSYAKGITDEFIEPAVLGDWETDSKDAIIFWNFREDRMRQIVGALCVPEYAQAEFPDKPFSKERTLCFTEYDHSYHLPFLFEPLVIKNHLGEVLSKLGISQLRVAETEKYPHVTYFFNGGIEDPYPAEERALIPSPRDVKTYDLKPEMSAHAVTEVVINSLRSQQHRVIVVNLANCDMVGHTGVLNAAIKAVETADTCVGNMVKALLEVGGTGVFIADHGNAEQMINYEDGTPHTAHTKYPVPMVVVGKGKFFTLNANGALCDVAPTVLALLGIAQPQEMTGVSLLSN